MSDLRKKATLTLIFPLDFLHTHTKPEDFPIFMYLMMLRPTKIQTVEWICLDLSLALVVKNSPANATDVRDAGSISGSGIFPGGGHGNPLQFLPGESHGQRSLAVRSPQGQ